MIRFVMACGLAIAACGYGTPDPLDEAAATFLIREINEGEPVATWPFDLDEADESVCIQGERLQQIRPFFEEDGIAIFENDDRLIEMTVRPVSEEAIETRKSGKWYLAACTIG